MKEQIKNKRGISWRGLCVCVILVGVGLGFLLPRYFGQFENLRAMSMQAMLVNVMIAEDQYQAKKGSYTDRWTELLPYVTQPETLEPELEAVAGRPDTYFFGFGKNAARKHRGYWVSLTVQPDKKSGTVKAVRTSNWLYNYELNRLFPEGNTNCTGTKMSRRFCKRFLTAIEGLELKNLVPVTKEEAEKSSGNKDKK